MPVDQMLHLRIAECHHPMNNVAMVITPPAEDDLNHGTLQNQHPQNQNQKQKNKVVEQSIATASLSRIYRFTP